MESRTQRFQVFEVFDFMCVYIDLFLLLAFNLNFGFLIEIEMMKERFAKLLLGEDMSGSGKGVCTAMGISNAITNLCGMISIFFLSVDCSVFCYLIAGGVVGLRSVLQQHGAWFY